MKMNFKLICSTFASLILLSSTAIAKDDANEKAIDARKAEMELRSFYAGPLFAMAKGAVDYDAAMASKLAGALSELSAFNANNGGALFWPKGSDVGAYPDRTTSKANIWTTYPEIADAGKKYGTAVANLAAEAGNGLDALRANIGPLGKSCKGCHDKFRTE